MPVIVNAVRTPIGSLNGTLANIKPDDLMSTVIKNSFANLGVAPSIVDEVVIGQTKQNAHYQNISRIAALKADIPERVPAYTVHRQCGSGMQSVHEAYMQVKIGMARTVLAGGVENMSQAHHYFIKNQLNKQGEITVFDSNIESQNRSQPENIYGKLNMAEATQIIAHKYNISREEQDEYAIESHERARKAIRTEQFQDEIVSIEIEEKNDFHLFTFDEQPKNIKMETLSKLEPIYQQNGTITSGNCASKGDGAASLIVMDENLAKSLGLTPLARIIGIGSSGVSLREMEMGSIYATNKALKMAGLTLKDIDLIELNEVFAAQTLAVLKEWGISNKKVNVNGGAIALGNPLGNSGTRILVTLVHEMERSGAKYGLATLCIEGGQGIATVIENCKI